MGDPQDLPIIQINYEDFAVLGKILVPYTAYVQNYHVHSFERSMKLLALQTLTLRIKQAVYQQDKPMMLTVAELQVIDEAFAFFIKFARQIIKASKKREDTLAACEKLKAYLKQSFPLAHADAQSG